jgi:hypothetical protein
MEVIGGGEEEGRDWGERGWEKIRFEIIPYGQLHYSLMRF